MKRKKGMAALIAVVMSLCVFVAPASGLQAKAEPDWSKNWNNVRVYTANFSKDVPSVNMQTPQTTIKLYAGLTWEALETNVGIRLNVSDSEYGASAQLAFQNLAASFGANLVKVLDMDLEKYAKSEGWEYHADTKEEVYAKHDWTTDIVTVNSPIRVCITLPVKSDLTKDYAVISVRGDGMLEILADLDPDPATITVDSAHFDTFAIVAGNKGAFDAYKIPSPGALLPIWVSNYTKEIGTTVSAGSNAYRLYDVGVVTDVATVRSVVGDQIVKLEMNDVQVGPNAKSALQYAAAMAGAKRVSYYEAELRNGRGERVTQTSQKLRITLTAPFDYPAYADYAVAVLNADGSVSILKDIDANDSTITIDTNQFRTYAVIWGVKGTFTLLP